MWLFNHSKGNISIVASLIHDAQEIAILEGTERFDIPALKIAYEKRLSMLHSYILPRHRTASCPKIKKVPLPPPQDNKTELPSIYEISQNAKKIQNNIVEALRHNEIEILEVDL